MDENKQDAVIEDDNGENEKLADQLDEELKKPLLTEIARKKHFREKFEKEKEARQKLQEELTKTQEQIAQKKEVVEKQPNPQNQPNESLAELASILKQYEPEELSKLEQFAKMSGKSIKEIAADPIVKAGLDSLRSAKKSEQSTPPPSSRSSVVIDNKPWTEMSSKERQDNLSKALEKMRG